MFAGVRIARVVHCGKVAACRLDRSGADYNSLAGLAVIVRNLASSF